MRPRRDAPADPVAHACQLAVPFAVYLAARHQPAGFFAKLQQGITFQPSWEAHNLGVPKSNQAQRTPIPARRAPGPVSSRHLPSRACPYSTIALCFMKSWKSHWACAVRFAEAGSGVRPRVQAFRRPLQSRPAKPRYAPRYPSCSSSGQQASFPHGGAQAGCHQAE